MCYPFYDVAMHLLLLIRCEQSVANESMKACVTGDGCRRLSPFTAVFYERKASFCVHFKHRLPSISCWWCCFNLFVVHTWANSGIFVMVAIFTGRPDDDDDDDE